VIPGEMFVDGREEFFIAVATNDLSAFAIDDLSHGDLVWMPPGDR
jgi:hypothetical protein